MQINRTTQSVSMVTYLDLSVVANGFDGRGVSQGGVCAAWTELDHSLGPAHQAGHSAAVLNQLLLLLLREISPRAPVNMGSRQSKCNHCPPQTTQASFIRVPL